MDKLIIQLESILLLKGEPVSVSWLAKSLDKKEEEINISLEQLSKQLENRGVRLVRNGNEVVLATAPESAEILKSIVKSEFDSELSKASLETLSIILYKNTASRAEIDYIRGVNSSFTVRNLMIRGLIERKTDPNDSRSWLYSPSFDFLKFMGIDKIENLAGDDEFKKEVEGLLNRKTKEAEQK